MSKRGELPGCDTAHYRKLLLSFLKNQINQSSKTKSHVPSPKQGHSGVNEHFKYQPAQKKHNRIKRTKYLKYHLTRLNPEETEDQSYPCRASAFQETKRGPRLSLSSSFSPLSTPLSCDSEHNTFKNPSKIDNTQPASTANDKNLISHQSWQKYNANSTKKKLSSPQYQYQQP